MGAVQSLGPNNTAQLQQLQKQVQVARFHVDELEALLAKRRLEQQQTATVPVAIHVEPVDLAQNMTLKAAQVAIIAQIEAEIAAAIQVANRAKDAVDKVQGDTANKRLSIEYFTAKINQLETERAAVQSQLDH